MKAILEKVVIQDGKPVQIIFTTNDQTMMNLSVGNIKLLQAAPCDLNFRVSLSDEDCDPQMELPETGNSQLAPAEHRALYAIVGDADEHAALKHGATDSELSRALAEFVSNMKLAPIAEIDGGIYEAAVRTITFEGDDRESSGIVMLLCPEGDQAREVLGVLQCLTLAREFLEIPYPPEQAEGHDTPPMEDEMEPLGACEIGTDDGLPDELDPTLATDYVIRDTSVRYTVEPNPDGGYSIAHVTEDSRAFLVRDEEAEPDTRGVWVKSQAVASTYSDALTAYRVLGEEAAHEDFLDPVPPAGFVEQCGSDGTVERYVREVAHA